MNALIRQSRLELLRHLSASTSFATGFAGLYSAGQRILEGRDERVRGKEAQCFP